MPVIEQLATEYSDRIDFVAVAWRSDLDSTAEVAASLIPSGAVQWGLDESQEIFAAYGIPYQPWTVTIVNGVEVNRWAGVLGEDAIRAELDALLDIVG